MAATVTPRVYTGSGAGTESSSVASSGIAFLSIDSASADSTTRATNPVVAGTSSYEKHVRFRVDASPSVSVGNFKVWTTTSQADANIDVRVKGSVGTGGASPGSGDATPTNAAMSSDASLYTYSSGSPLTIDSGTYGSVGSPAATGTVSKAVLFQLKPNSSASPGPIAQHTIGYSYDEV